MVKYITRERFLPALKPIYLLTEETLHSVSPFITSRAFQTLKKNEPSLDLHVGSSNL